MSKKPLSKEKKEKGRFKLSKLHITLIIVACVLVAAITVVSCLATTSSGIYGGISVCGIPVNGLTAEEAALSLEEALNDKSPSIEISIDNEVISLNFKDFGEYDFETSAKKAFEYGRNNFFAQLYTYSTPFVNRNLPLEFYIDEDAISKRLRAEYLEFDNSYVETSYEIKDDKLIITSGRGGNAVDTENIIEQIKKGISMGEDLAINATISHKDYEGVDIDAIYNEISSKPENAYYDEANGKIVPHKLGYSFDKAAAKEKTANAEEDTVFEIQLTVEYPEVTEAKLSGKMFEDVLASYTTNYNPGEVNRTHNMSLAGQRVNGTVLAPGQIFSYNGVVGERTVAKGYKNAKIFENGRVVDGLAGGICQVSTTIYNAALYSNMEIVERKNHSFPVSYAPMGQDATVVMGTIDFRFKNTMKNPIKITCTISGGNCTVSILGIKEKNYKVEINNVITGSTPFGTEYQHDESMEIGKEKVIQKGSNGYTIKSTRTVYENGQVVKTESLPSSYYIPLKQIVARNETGMETNPEDPNAIPPQDGAITQPENQPEGQPEQQPEGQPETSPEAQPEQSPESQLEQQSENQSEVQPENQPVSSGVGTETEINQ